MVYPFIFFPLRFVPRVIATLISCISDTGGDVQKYKDAHQIFEPVQDDASKYIQLHIA